MTLRELEDRLDHAENCRRLRGVMPPQVWPSPRVDPCCAEPEMDLELDDAPEREAYEDALRRE